MRTPRALLVLLGCAALALAAVQGLTGMQELVFYGGPFLLLIGLLLSGRFIGEDAILARHAAARRSCGRPPGAGRRCSSARSRRCWSAARGSSEARRSRRFTSPETVNLLQHTVRRSRCGPSPSPPRWSRCCSAHPWPSPTRATRTTAPS